MFNVMKKRAAGLREEKAKMVASHDQRRSSPDKEPKYGLSIKSLMREIPSERKPGMNPEAAPFETPSPEEHNAIADHHQKLADHYRAMSQTDAAGRPVEHEKPLDTEEEAY